MQCILPVSLVNTAIQYNTVLFQLPFHQMLLCRAAWQYLYWHVRHIVKGIPDTVQTHVVQLRLVVFIILCLLPTPL